MLPMLGEYSVEEDIQSKHQINNQGESFIKECTESDEL